MEINGYEDYLIYQDGRVYSKKSNIYLKHKCTAMGYYKVDLCKNGKHKHFFIHRLIALYYIPNPDNKPNIDHKDRNRKNNNISNLRWATQKENMNNKNKRNDNTSGHTNISYIKNRYWRYRKGKHQKYFKSKIDAICYKFIMILVAS